MIGNNSVLKLEDVSKIYKMDGLFVKALDNVSLAIKEGEFVSIIGPSGSGKSTLMHIIGCLDVPTSGKVTLEHHEVSKMTERELAHIRNKKIGFVFQQFNLLPRTSALENASLPLVYNGTAESDVQKKAKEALEKVGLGERLDHHPNQLSGGQQQRVAIARALVTDPAIILADEPTGNLDSKSGVEVMEIFKKLHQQGRTIVLVTHDQNTASQAQRTIKLKDGKIVS
ncbi:MAG: Macrolide export ATP-binding/permease protein MacB [Microgenomates group bacterium ADurb.Bin219]|nr:MAG: Macrolide export ATP-binding/permease protein MacB [Microgenomates group bacterium ADurb.Bin219]HNP89226.1 ABC transporter ATP-binding protein [Candidatus Woesebacteria bacterium]